MAIAGPSAFTPEDLLLITDRPMPELVLGELNEREMDEESDGIAAMILRIVANHVLEHDLGRVHGAQCGYQIFPDDPRKVRIPDVSFIRKGSPVARGHAKTVPNLVVEVLSPNDLAVDLIEKLEDYHAAGVPLIWIVDPEMKTVRVERRDGVNTRLRADDTIDGGDTLPGFRCIVREFFT